MAWNCIRSNQLRLEQGAAEMRRTAKALSAVRLFRFEVGRNWEEGVACPKSGGERRRKYICRLRTQGERGPEATFDDGERL